MTPCEREGTIAHLYKLSSTAKLTLESQMNAIIRDGASIELRMLLMDIVETSVKLLKDNPAFPPGKIC